MIKVYGTPTSPFVRKVLFTLATKQLTYELIPLNPLDLPLDYKKISPTMKIPAYQDDNVTLADSTVICEYLEDCHPELGVYPKDAIAKAQCRWFEEYADGKMVEVFGALVMERVIKPVILKQEGDEAVIDKAINENIPPVMDYLEIALEGCEFLVGSELTLADVAVAGIFINAKIASYEVDSTVYPNVAAHFERVCSKPNVAVLLPMFEEAASKFIQ